jgi:hypothetical protein
LRLKLLRQEEKEIKLGQSSSAKREEIARKVAEQQQSREQEHKLHVLNLEHRTTLLMLQVMFASAAPKLTVKDYSWIARDHKTPVCTRIAHFDACDDDVVL